MTPPPTITITIDPRVRAFATQSAVGMSMDHAGSIIGADRRTMTRLCENGKIEAQCLTGARSERVVRTHGNRRFTISQASLLSYIIRSTTGDRELVLKAIEQECPAWLAFARDVAAGRGTATTAAEVPANVIPMRGVKRRREDPYSGVPEMFPPEDISTRRAQQSA